MVQTCQRTNNLLSEALNLKLKKIKSRLSVVAHSYNPNTEEFVAGRSPWDCEFQASQEYNVISFLKKAK